MKKHILITLCGISPAVVTETVFVLARRGDPPDKVIVITTQVGAEALKEELFDSGIWKSLTDVLQHKISLVLNHDHCRLLPDEGGNATDITDTRSVDRAANFILDVLRQYTENPDVRVTFSIAGGRKSMTAVGALCMSLLGRADDRLCHILVNPPFDDPTLTPKFYFPVSGQTYTTREGKCVNAAGAVLELSELPFVRCRYLIETQLKRLSGDYSQMVALANRNAAQLELPTRLELDPAELLVCVGARQFSLQFQMFLLYWMLAERKIANRDFLYNAKDLCEEFIDFIEQARAVMPPKFCYQCLSLMEPGKIREQTLHKRISDLGAELKKHGLPKALMPTQCRGTYGLGIDGAQITVRTSGGSPKS